MPTAARTKNQAESRERSRQWHQQRRARGVCCQAPCTNPATAINPRTGAPYWACRACRMKRSTASSSNGRTSDFQSENPGSIPGDATSPPTGSTRNVSEFSDLSEGSQR